MREPTSGSRIYVRGLNWIGDAVLSLGALQGLRAVRPDLSITVGAPEATADVYRLSPAVDRVLPLAPRGGFRGFLTRGIGERFDLALVFPRSFSSAFDSFLLASRRVGFASEGRSLLLTERLSYAEWKGKRLHQSTYYEALVRTVDPRAAFESPRLSFSPEQEKQARSRLEEISPGPGPILAVNPGAFYGRAKTWPSAHFLRLLGDLLKARPDLTVVLFSGKADKPLAKVLEEGIHSPRLISLAGTLSLAESAALLAHSSLLLTNDSGMMHLGGAAGRPGVALFGPTDPGATGPVPGPSGERFSVLIHKVACAPCRLRECPIDHRCMEGLTPDLVREEILRLLPEPR
ncbi:MAG: lipopolysaccharide heptosyltransferase II [Leptospirillia bacterium]